MGAPVLRVALTGGIATGKSYCLGRFGALGVPTIDADALSHAVVAPGTTGLAAVVARFGKDVLGANGGLDRAALGEVVFADALARADLEAIIHPLVYTRISEWFATLDVNARPSASTPGFAIADIPLLYETGHERDFDRVVVTACSASVQQQRLADRGFSPDEIRQRLDAQMSTDTKRARADVVIDTNGSKEVTDRQVAAIFEALRRRRQER
jgi:dephospho-CoA kinase